MDCPKESLLFARKLSLSYGFKDIPDIERGTQYQSHVWIDTSTPPAGSEGALLQLFI